MPLKRCQSNGEDGWKWGDEGKCYTGRDAKRKALNQGIAIGDINTTKSDEEDGDNMNIFEQFENWWLEKFEFEDEIDANNDVEKDEDSALEKNKKTSKSDKTGKNDEKTNKKAENLNIVPARGKVGAKVMFVGASPSKIDFIRKHLFSGPAGKTLKDSYLEELVIKSDDAAYATLVPLYLEDERGNPRVPNQKEINEWADDFVTVLDKYDPDYLVALGTVARDGIERILEKSFGDTADEWVPHPRALNIFGDKGEVARKLGRLREVLQSDDVHKSMLDKESEDIQSEDIQYEAEVLKADDEKQVVYGIVYEPEVEDTDGNWATAEEIEKAAYYFMENHQTLGHEHIEDEVIENAHVVESWLAPKDMELYGQDVKKGTWLVGVHVNDDERWNMVKSGDYNGFSIHARAKIDPSKRLES